MRVCLRACVLARVRAGACISVGLLIPPFLLERWQGMKLLSRFSLETESRSALSKAAFTVCRIIKLRTAIRGYPKVASFTRC